jgi:predicted acetyltransferase
MPFDIQRITDFSEDNYLALRHLLDMSFGNTPPYKTDSLTNEQQNITRQSTPLRVTFSAYDAGKGGNPKNMVASVGYYPMQQNLRGNVLKMAGVAAVISHPRVRRQGVIRDLIRTSFENMYEEGYALTALYAFRDSFYGRMSYAQLPAPQVIRFNPAILAPLFKRMDTTFRWTKFWENTAQAYTYSQMLEQHLLSQHHGEVIFDDSDVLRLRYEYQPHHFVSVESEGWAGYMVYRNEDGVMHVPRFAYADSDALMWLLTWIARHTDQIEYAQIKISPHERPELWHPDIRPQWQTRDDVPPMTRILNMDAIQHLRFDAPFMGDVPEVTLRVRDAMCPWHDGNVYQFARVDNGLQIQRVNGEAQAELNIAGITAWLFGTHDPAQFKWYGWGEPSHSTIQTMRTMMPFAQPYMSWFF